MQNRQVILDNQNSTSITHTTSGLNQTLFEGSEDTSLKSLEAQLATLEIALRDLEEELMSLNIDVTTTSIEIETLQKELAALIQADPKKTKLIEAKQRVLKKFQDWKKVYEEQFRLKEKIAELTDPKKVEAAALQAQLDSVETAIQAFEDELMEFNIDVKSTSMEILQKELAAVIQAYPKKTKLIETKEKVLKKFQDWERACEAQFGLKEKIAELTHPKTAEVGALGSQFIINNPQDEERILSIASDREAKWDFRAPVSPSAAVGSLSGLSNDAASSVDSTRVQQPRYFSGQSLPFSGSVSSLPLTSPIKLMGSSLKSQLINIQPLKEPDHSTQEAALSPSQTVLESKKLENAIRKIDQFKKMPECAEKIMLEIYVYLQLKVHESSPTFSQLVQEHQTILAWDISSKIVSLNKFLEQEVSSFESIQSLYQDIRQNLEVKNWINAEKKVNELLRIIRPFDIYELLHLIQKADEAGRSMEGKDIILLLGGTGTGKSTTIHFLSGSRMISQLVNGLPHITADLSSIQHENLLEVKMSPHAVSETRYVSMVPISSDVDGLIDGTVYLCDTPGFGDTRSHELDMANTMGIIRAIQRCNSVRPVILISHQIGERGERFKELARILMALVPRIDDYIGNFSYLFTKWDSYAPRDRKKMIYAKLQDIYNHLQPQEKEDKAFSFFFRKIIEKLNGGNAVITVDPLIDNPSSVLGQLLDAVPIDKPKSAFSFGTGSDAKAKVELSKQLAKHEASVLRALKQNNYTLIEYKLQELNALNEILATPEINQLYHGLVGIIKKHLNEQYRDTKIFIERVLLDENQLTLEDITHYQNIITDIQAVESLRDSHLGKETISVSSYINLLNELLSTQWDPEKINALSYQQIKVRLNKLKQFNDTIRFSELKSHLSALYQSALNLLEKKYESARQSLDSGIEKQDLGSIFQRLQDVNIMIHFFDAYFLGDLSNKKLVSLKKLEEKLDAILKQQETLLIQSSKSKEEIFQLKELSIFLEKAKKVLLETGDVNCQSMINQCYDAFYSRLDEYLRNEIKRVNTVLDKNAEHRAVQAVESKVIELKLLHDEIAGIRPRIAESYYPMLENIIGLVKDARMQIERLLAEAESKEQVDYTNLIQSLVIFSQAGWVDQLRPGDGSRPGIYAQITQEVEKRILEYVSSIEESMSSLDLSSVESFKPAELILKKITGLEKIGLGLGSAGYRDAKRDFALPVSPLSSPPGYLAAADGVDRSASPSSDNPVSSQGSMAVQPLSSSQSLLSSGYSSPLRSSGVSDILNQVKKQLEQTRAYFEVQVLNTINDLKKSFDIQDQTIYSHQQTLSKLQVLKTSYDSQKLRALLLAKHGFQDIKHLGTAVLEQQKQLKDYIKQREEAQANFSFVDKNLNSILDEYHQKLKKQKSEANKFLISNNYGDEKALSHSISNNQDSSRALKDSTQREISTMQKRISELESVQKEYNQLDPQAVSENGKKLLQEAKFASEAALLHEIQSVELIIRRHSERENESSYLFTGLNSEKAEYALQYLDAVKKLQQQLAIKQDASQAFEQVNAFLIKYRENLAEQASSYFSKLNLPSQATEIHAVESEKMKYANTLLLKWHELSELSQVSRAPGDKQFPKLSNCFLPILNDMKRTLSEHVQKFSDELEEDSQMSGEDSATTHDFKIKILIAKLLRPLDRYIIDSPYKYGELYTKYQNQLYGMIQSIDKSILKAIEEKKYIEVRRHIERLEQAKEKTSDTQYRQIQSALEISFQNLVQETLTLVIQLEASNDEGIDLEKIKSIVKRLDQLEEARSCAQSYSELSKTKKITMDKLLDPKQHGLIKKNIEQVINRFLDQIDALIDSYEFLESEKKITNIRGVVDTLGKHIVKNIIEAEKEDQNSSTDKKLPINERVGKLKHQIDDNLKKVVERYKELNKEENSEEEREGKPKKQSKEKKEGKEKKSESVVRSVTQLFRKHPPKTIIKKFEEVQRVHARYRNYSAQILEEIERAFARSLEEAASKAREGDPLESDRCIREIRSILNMLPDPEPFKAEIHEAEQRIKAEKEAYSSIIEGALMAENFGKLIQLFDTYKNAPIYTNKMREGIIQRLQEHKNQVQSRFEQKDAQQLMAEHQFLTLKKCLQYYQKFNQEVPDLSDIYEGLKKSFDASVEQVKSVILAQFVYPDIDLISPDKIKEVDKALEYLIGCGKLRMRMAQDTELTHIVDLFFPKNFTQDMQLLLPKCIEYLNWSQTQYLEKGLVEKKIGLVKKGLDNALKWVVVLNKLKDNMVLLQQQQFYRIDDDEMLKKIKIYPEMIDYVVQSLQEWHRFLVKESIVNDETKANEQRRNAYYQGLNSRLKGLSEARAIEDHLRSFPGLPWMQFEKQAKDALTKKLNEICASIGGSLKKDHFIKMLLKSSSRSNEFSIFYDHLVSFRQLMEEFDRSIIDKTITDVQNLILSKMQELQAKIKTQDEKGLDEIADYLVQMKSLAYALPSYKEVIDEQINESLLQVKKKLGAATIGLLGAILAGMPSGVGQLLIEEHQALEGYARLLIIEKMSKQDLNYVIDRIEGEGILVDKDELKKSYQDYYTFYDQLTTAQLVKNASHLDQVDTTEVVNNAKTTASRLSKGGLLKNGKGKQTINWTPSIRKELPHLLAHVFAVWTLQNTQHYAEAEGDHSKKMNYLLRPHPAQVIGILRILGVGDGQVVKSQENKTVLGTISAAINAASTAVSNIFVEAGDLNNNLVQIGTGEGKSVTLAVTSIVLALLGCQVRVACYSNYLSERDYNAFQKLFEAFDVTPLVRYGTFAQLCEQEINQYRDVRESVRYTVLGQGQPPAERAQANQPKVLLIDEVDVFFDQDFYGNLYNPTASLIDPSIKTLSDFVWQQRSNISFSKIKATKIYEEARQRFNGWESLLDEMLKDLIGDVKDFRHDYVVQDDKIGYKDQDSISFNLTYGYKTLFAYYDEHSKGRISQKSLEEHITLNVRCGSFSYAEVPKSFHCIMGVTGTLRTLGMPQREIVENIYQIQKKTYLPSVFGQNDLTFAEDADIHIEREEDYFNQIVREIDAKSRGGQRAVLIFFESKQKLEEFYQCPSMTAYQDRVMRMTEELSNKEKSLVVKQITRSGQIGLLTRSFGRGTDFICYDKTVIEQGGIHVIQTFLSPELSEEVQIKGRTARQGGKGSYSMVLLETELEKLGILKEHVAEMRSKNQYYLIINKKRNHHFEVQYTSRTQNIVQVKTMHDESMEFLYNLNQFLYNKHNKNAYEFIKAFLVRYNGGPKEGNECSRTLCLMDATGSMDHLLEKAKNTVKTMFFDAKEILAKNGLSDKNFSMQFAVYRNYNSEAKLLLQSSPWETKPENLADFMNRVEIDGGWGNEAIEIGLWHANEEMQHAPVSQVILIGDAPANTEKEIKEKRANQKKGHGEAYWQKTKFNQPTFWRREVDRLKKRDKSSVPIHTFYLDQRAEENFKEIARITGGSCEKLDIESKAGADQLSALVTSAILKDVGDSVKPGRGDELVEAFKRSKTYR